MYWKERTTSREGKGEANGGESELGWARANRRFWFFDLFLCEVIGLSPIATRWIA